MHRLVFVMVIQFSVLFSIMFLAHRLDCELAFFFVIKLVIPIWQ